MTKQTLKTLTLALALAVVMAGCGNRTPANAPIDDTAASASPAPSLAPAGPTDPVPTTPAAPAYTQPTTGSLTVGSIEKKMVGFFFKKLEVKGTVTNTSNVALSGTLKVQFKKSKGLISKSLVADGSPKTQDIASLGPNQSTTFTITSDGKEADAEITVDTNTPAAPAAGAATPAMGAQSVHQAGPYGY